MTITDEMVEQTAEALINQVRADHGLPPLKLSDPALRHDIEAWLKCARTALEAALSGKEER